MGSRIWRVRTRLQDTRRRITTAAAAGLGLALLAPLLTVAPAQAGLLEDTTETLTEPITDPLTGELIDPVLDSTTGIVTDPATGEVIGVLDPVTGELLLAPVPAVGPGSAGEILVLVDGALRQLCSSAATGCDQVPLGEMVDEAAIVLKAVPAKPGDIPAWDPASCPEIVADICVIAAGDLVGGTPLAPLVSFISASNADPAAPETVITSGEIANKQTTEHRFTFVADPATEDTGFLCKLEVAYKSTPPADAQRAHDWQPCEDQTGAQSYAKLANGTYVFAVQAFTGPPADPTTIDETPATQSWTVAVAPEVPETKIVSGPRGNSWLFGRRAAFRFRSTVEDSRFQCSYDRMTSACDDAAFVWRPKADGARLTPGTHVFKVAAMAHKTQDFSPAIRTFHVPLDDRGMRTVKKWNRKKQKGHFKNTFTQTRVKGAKLVTKRKHRFRRVVLIADKGRGFGTVKVFWGNRMLRKVDLHAKRPLAKRKVIRVKKFHGKLRSGRLRVVVTSRGKPVRIDGIGLARR
jgi:hypothetical protein